MFAGIFVVVSTLAGCHQYDGKCRECVTANLSEFPVPRTKTCVYAGFEPETGQSVTKGNCYKRGGKTHRKYPRKEGWLDTDEECSLPTDVRAMGLPDEALDGEPISTTQCARDGRPDASIRASLAGCFVAVVDSTQTRAWTSMDQADARCSKEHPHTMRTINRWAEIVLSKSGSSEVVIVNSNFFYAPPDDFNPYATKCTTVHGLLCSEGKIIHGNIEPGHKEDIADSYVNTTHSLVIANDGTAQILKPENNLLKTCSESQAIVSGYRLLESGHIVNLKVKDPGEYTPAKDPRLRWYHFVQHAEALPRTAVGIRTDGKLVVVSANNGERSNNLTVLGTARYLKELDVVDAIMLDGGGSTHMLHLRNGEQVRSTMASDMAQYRSEDKPVVEEHLSGCERKIACKKSSRLPCTVGVGCHRPVPAFLAFTPK